MANLLKCIGRRKSASEIMQEAMAHLEESRNLISKSFQMVVDSQKESLKCADIASRAHSQVYKAANRLLELAQMNNELAGAWCGESAQRCIDAQADCHHIGVSLFGNPAFKSVREKVLVKRLVACRK